MCGTQAFPTVGDLIRKADSFVPYASLALNVVSWVAPEYCPAAMHPDAYLGAVSMCPNAAHYVANAASSKPKMHE